MPTEQPANILLVDDHPENLLALEAILEPLGQHLVQALSGEEALKCMLREDFAVVLLDVQMPGIDGFETAELIRGRPRSRHTPIIFLTAINTSDTHVSRGYAIGAVDYLMKPIVPEILFSKVSVFVELYRKTQHIERQSAELEVTIKALEHQIDERLRVEAALRSARDELEQRVRERTAGLAQANQSLRAEIAERERAEQSLRLLAEASRMLAESLEYEERLSAIARLALPLLGDWCAIDVLAEDDTLQRMAIATEDPAKHALEREIQARYPGVHAMPPGLAQVLLIHEPVICTALDDELPPLTRDDEHLALVRSSEITSTLSVPLSVRDRVLGVLSFGTCDADRHYGQADLQLAEDLARRVAVAIDNARLYRAAQDSIQLRDVFLSVAAHELRTPLTSLFGYTQLVERRALRHNTLDERDRQALQIVTAQVNRLNKMVTSLLDISRLQLGQLSIESAPLDLGALAARLVDEARPLLSEHTIDYRGPDEPALISGDELRLEQALQNLIQNAVKYSPRGGTIGVRVEREEDTIAISVSDPGIGIPAEARSQLFQRFYRAPNVNPQHISGLGVGLYVVKEIVDLHGGTIEIQSEVGAGSTFTLCLPVLGEKESLAMLGAEAHALGAGGTDVG